MTTATCHAVRGTIAPNSQFRSDSVGTHALVNPLERLAQLMRANDRLMDELATSRERVSRARSYLDEPACNARFGAAHLDRCRIKHAGVLAQLRANRIEALDLLARSESPAA